MKVINRNGNIAICPGKGETLSMIGNKWYLNGKEINLNDYCQDNENNHITINIEGSLDRLEIDSCDRIIVHGDCKRIRQAMEILRSMVTLQVMFTPTVVTLSAAMLMAMFTLM